MDSYTDYSDSAPRTPSPNDIHFNAQQPKDLFYRNTLLQELYDDQYHIQPQQDNWNIQSGPLRRATFPYARHDRDDQLAYSYSQHPQPQHHHHQQRHQDAHHHHQHQHHQHQQHHYFNDRPTGPLDRDGPYVPSSTYDDTGNIKIEDGAPPLVVPSQSPFYRTGSGSTPMTGGMPPYISPHTGLPIQHTDDAASKETQYLRRRCFNCHTTEPPSWRRSTLNPGKIVCNKCGLYERTHLRPRPLRFDELRSGNKTTRKQKTNGGGPSSTSPRQPKLGVVKKEPREFLSTAGGGIVRRSSVSSSSVSSSGASDWDDNVSVYSSGSAPPTSFNSPTVPHFSLSSSSRDSTSPPALQIDGAAPGGSIRLPNNPLSELSSSSSSSSPHSGTSPHLPPSLASLNRSKSHTSPLPVFYSPSSIAQNTMSPGDGAGYFGGAPRRGSGSPHLQEAASVGASWVAEPEQILLPNATTTTTTTVGSPSS